MNSLKSFVGAALVVAVLLQPVSPAFAQLLDSTSDSRDSTLGGDRVGGTGMGSGSDGSDTATIVGLSVLGGIIVVGAGTYLWKRFHRKKSHPKTVTTTSGKTHEETLGGDGIETGDGAGEGNGFGSGVNDFPYDDGTEPGILISDYEPPPTCDKKPKTCEYKRTFATTPNIEIQSVTLQKHQIVGYRDKDSLDPITKSISPEITLDPNKPVPFNPLFDSKSALKLCMDAAQKDVKPFKGKKERQIGTTVSKQCKKPCRCWLNDLKVFRKGPKGRYSQDMHAAVGYSLKSKTYFTCKTKIRFTGYHKYHPGTCRKERQI